MRFLGAYYCFPIVVVTLFGDGRTTNSYACPGSDHDNVLLPTHQHHRVEQEQVEQARPERCGTPDLRLSKQQVKMFRNKMAATQKTIPDKNAGPVVIDVSFQVISNGALGNIPQQYITDQMTVLNNAYAPHGFQFNLRETVRTDNADLYNRCITGFDDTFKEGLRDPSDGLDVLYFYTCEFIPDPSGGSLLGYATFPPGLDSFFLPPLDGIVCHSQSLPGGSFAKFNLGAVATHEIGHWLGLLHTFQDGCDGGDYVDDTPAQNEPNRGCPVTPPDTCPAQPGDDPIENYMNYSDNVCMTEFTAGQTARMQATWNIYRSGAASAIPIIELEVGVPLGGQSLTAGTWQRYRIAEIPLFAVSGSVTLTGNNGDADLFVGYCSSASPGDADESCSGFLFGLAEDDGSILIDVYAAAAFTGWTITATADGLTPAQLDNASQTISGLARPEGDIALFVIKNVPPGTSLSVETNGKRKGDADLFVFLGAPLASKLVCASETVTMNESCDIAVIGDSTMDVFIVIFAYSTFADLTLTVTYNAAVSPMPSTKPSAKPSKKPSSKPSVKPSKKPSAKPSRDPSSMPLKSPTEQEQCGIFLFLLALILRIFTLGLVNLCD